MVYRYKPEAQNLINNKYSGFRGGISFGTKRNAQKFITQRKKDGIYKKFRIKRIKC